MDFIFYTSILPAEIRWLNSTKQKTQMTWI